jgi:uncharacterized protein with von Willebrand factor type A (vWA) domain
MFLDFFYALRQEGIPVSANEWLVLMEALKKGLAHNSLTGFYYLARATLVKSETYFDRYDTVFAAYFQGVAASTSGEEATIEWLKDLSLPEISSPGDRLGPPPLNGDERRPSLDDRLADLESLTQEGVSNTGSGGSAEFGSSGTGGNIRMGGGGGGLTAIKVAAKRKFRDYRDDNITGTRQFELALRSLRQLSSRFESPKDDLDLEATVNATGRNAGMLRLVWERPRRNTLKLIVLMDSVGSIDRYHNVCSRLFMAAHKATHFKEIKFYYFHNCIYDCIYKSSVIDRSKAIPTEEFMRDRGPEYRVIIVGDAAMSPSELTVVGGAISWDDFNAETGVTWLRRVARHFPYAVWLNPVPAAWWGREPNFTSIPIVEDILPMYELSPKGLEKAIKKIRAKSK